VRQEGAAHEGLKQEIVNQLINERLVLQAARKANIKVQKTEVMKAYDGIVAGASMKEEAFLRKLRERGMSKDRFIKSVEDDLMIRKFRDTLAGEVAISDNELKDYYNSNRSAFTVGDQVRLSVIRVNGLEEAKKVKREIDKGAKFEDMSRKYPGGHKEQGAGETGWVTIGTFPRDIAQEIGKIKAGSFAGPIRGKEGYYLIKVIEKMEKNVSPFDQVKENIRHALLQQKVEDTFRTWLQNERKQAKIEVVKRG